MLLFRAPVCSSLRIRFPLPYHNYVFLPFGSQTCLIYLFCCLTLYRLFSSQCAASFRSPAPTLPFPVIKIRRLAGPVPAWRPILHPSRARVSIPVSFKQMLAFV